MLVLRVSVAVGAIGLLLGTQNIRELAGTLGDLSLWAFLAALGLYGVAQAVFVVRWRLLSGVQSAHFGFFTGMKLHFLGLFYNNCLPSSVGGDLIRAWYVTHHCDNDKRDEAALSVFVDRAVGLVGMLAMAGVFYWLVPGGAEAISGGGQESGENGGILAKIALYRKPIIMIIAVIATVAGMLMLNGRVRSLARNAWQKVFSLALRMFFKSLKAFKLYAKSLFVMFLALLLTFLTQGLCIIGFYLCGRSLGIDVHMRYYFVLFPISWLIGAIPVSIGGMGLMEGALLVGFANLMGGGQEAERLAIAVAICQRLIFLTGSLPGLVIHLLGAHLPADREEFFVDSSDSMD